MHKWDVVASQTMIGRVKATSLETKYIFSNALILIILAVEGSKSDELEFR